MKFLIAALALTLFNVAARAEDAPCAVGGHVPATLAPVSNVGDYQSVLQVCSAPGLESEIAIRTMTLEGRKALLLANPETLTTELQAAACWTCREAEDSDYTLTRMSRAVAASAQVPSLTNRGFLENAGLTHGVGDGVYLTGDLCPSTKPLDRGFLDRVEAYGPHTPIALSISGLWLKHHFDDYRWLVDAETRGALDILWVNHSFHHPFKRGVAFDHNFLLTPGVNPDEEILDTERYLIANGGTPSLFFRFPGLISNAPLMEAARQHHLIALGADAWLALKQQPKPGSIILVHPNGNEPQGLKIFVADVASGAIPTPLDALNAAPR